jgi:hypothetical protein
LFFGAWSKEGKTSQSIAAGNKITFRKEDEGLVLLSEI